MRLNDLYAIVKEYSDTVETLPNFDKGFERKGSAFFICLCQNKPSLRNWVAVNYPDAVFDKIEKEKMRLNDLYAIVKEYSDTVETLPNFDKGFERKGSAFFICLCQNKPSLRNWVAVNYPDAVFDKIN